MEDDTLGLPQWHVCWGCCIAVVVVVVVVVDMDLFLCEWCSRGQLVLSDSTLGLLYGNCDGDLIVWIDREYDDDTIRLFDRNLMGLFDDAVLKLCDGKFVVGICLSS